MSLIYPLPDEVGRITGFRVLRGRALADTDSGVVCILPFPIEDTHHAQTPA